ncbi:MAG: porin [Candidatus Kapabacteria bacterium]|nr:porin [Candidatus Kapabacteria bacterium]
MSLSCRAARIAAAFAIAAFSILISSHLRAQSSILPDRFFYRNGINFVAGDSSFSMNLRFRIQSLATFETAPRTDDVIALQQMNWITRRMRLRMNGFAFNPQWTYAIQLSFTRGDMDWDNVNYPNILRDANISYSPTNDLTFMMGLAKLPGNRERVISSGDLQFVDRSLLNRTFNIDRDFGFQARYSPTIGGVQVVAQGALSSGDGRNVVNITKSLASTARVGIYPFGAFTNNGDMFLGDLEFEKTPKLYIAGVAHHNPGAIRTGGQIGEFFNPSYNGNGIPADSITRTMDTYFVDGMFKYQGFMLFGEWAKRVCEKPSVTVGSTTRLIYSGTGLNLQASYLWTNHFETALRYTHIAPDAASELVNRKQQQITVCNTYYLMRHRIKLQLDATQISTQTAALADTYNKNYLIRFQTEFGI